jgi:N-acetylglucosaminyldiphosphoundecaprenol N-acetyl-beta-D-mannosaminyltransferase
MHPTEHYCNDQPNRDCLFALPLDIGTQPGHVLEKLTSGNLLLTYLNPYSYAIAKKYPEYVNNLDRFDLIVCDGIGIQKAVKTVHRVITPIISLDYYGIGRSYLQLAADRKMSLCLVGAEEEVVQTAVIRIGEEYSGLQKISAFCGYGKSPEAAKQFILASSPDMVLAGLGMGRQEAFLLDLDDAGWAGVGICVGAFFDKLANPQLKYPEWTEKTNLRFLGRLMKEPRRMSKRYFVDYQPFIRKYLGHLLGWN